MTIMAVKHCERVDRVTHSVVILISGGELGAAPSAPALGKGNV